MAAFSGGDRRRFLQAGVLTGLHWVALPSAAAQARATEMPFWAEVVPTPAAPVLAAAWGRGDDAHVGLLRPTRAALELLWSHPVPTRAHGMARLSDGALLFASRRPGDWLLRVDVAKVLAKSGNFAENAENFAEFHWIEPDRAFNGHAIAWGACVLTSETDLATGGGLIGVRHALTLEKIAEWPTAGRDPHQLLRDPADPTALLVANGGIVTQSDTGRRKLQRQAMDSSLVRLRVLGAAAQDLRAHIDGQWRLSDVRISLRHLAWGARVDYENSTKNQQVNQRRWLGVATQAEHDEESERQAAPILALWDGQRLTTAQGAPAHAAWGGYGGDIAWDFSQNQRFSPSKAKATLGRGLRVSENDGQPIEKTGLFAVSAPRADALTWWQPPRTPDTPAQLVAERTMLGAYAVAEWAQQGIWAAGQYHVGHWQNAENAHLENASGLLFDNHWQVF